MHDLDEYLVLVVDSWVVGVGEIRCVPSRALKGVYRDWVGLAMDVCHVIPYLSGGGVCCWDCGGFVFGVSCCSSVSLSVE